MFSFFRRLRLLLLANGRLSKYFVYALGEILLVVLGILIALQINNWNESQKSGRLEQQYLQSLKQEFLVNRNKLESLDSLLAVQLEASIEFTRSMNPKKILLDDADFARVMRDGFRDTHSYNPSSGVMKDLINSGKLSLIKNDQLRRVLADWESNIAHVVEFEDEAKRASYDVVEILRSKGNFREQMHATFKALGTGPSQFRTSNTHLLNLEVLESSVVYFTGVTWRLKNVLYPNLSEKMDDVLSMIEQEIE